LQLDFVQLKQLTINYNSDIGFGGGTLFGIFSGITAPSLTLQHTLEELKLLTASMNGPYFRKPVDLTGVPSRQILAA